MGTVRTEVSISQYRPHSIISKVIVPLLIDFTSHCMTKLDVQTMLVFAREVRFTLRLDIS